METVVEITWTVCLVTSACMAPVESRSGVVWRGVVRGNREGGDVMWSDVVRWSGERRRESLSEMIWTVDFITIASLTLVRGSIV